MTDALREAAEKLSKVWDKGQTIEKKEWHKKILNASYSVIESLAAPEWLPMESAPRKNEILMRGTRMNGGYYYDVVHKSPHGACLWVNKEGFAFPAHADNAVWQPLPLIPGGDK